MELEVILDIKRLKAEYPKTDSPALICNNIKLHRSQIYFVIGKSGIGKSTFLESVGLMSNTIKDDENEIYYKDREGSISLSKMWGNKDISDFRAKNYAFIFQENNLMKHFSAGENMSFGLLQAGMSMEKARTEILPIMSALGLPQSYFESEIQELSGGERQRLAFIRAITAEFSILFCDEPTGNLDPNLAKKVMDFLHDTIHENHKTAIIVSHDIDLARTYADHIFIIRPGTESNGVLNPSQVVSRSGEDWMFSDKTLVPNIREYLIESII